MNSSTPRVRRNNPRINMPVVFRAREVCDAGRGGQEAELDLAKTELARLQFLEQQQYGDEQVIMSEHHHTTFIRSAKVCAKVRS